MVSNPEQSAIRQEARLNTMVENTRIVSAELQGEYGLIVTFTDGTEDAYPPGPGAAWDTSLLAIGLGSPIAKPGNGALVRKGL